MKLIETTKQSTLHCKRSVNKAFGKKLPHNAKWVRKNQLTWILSVGARDVAMVVNLGNEREILLDQTYFEVKTTNPPKRAKKKSKKKRVTKDQFPPPFKHPTPAKLKDIILQHDLNVRENPPPSNCPKCGMRYTNMKTGLDFGTVQDMLFVDTNDRDFWRQKGRSSVLGLWYEIKRSMWLDHLQMCGDTVAQQDYLEDFEY